MRMRSGRPNAHRYKQKSKCKRPTQECIVKMEILQRKKTKRDDAFPLSYFYWSKNRIYYSHFVTFVSNAFLYFFSNWRIFIPIQSPLCFIHLFVSNAEDDDVFSGAHMYCDMVFGVRTEHIVWLSVSMGQHTFAHKPNPSKVMHFKYIRTTYVDHKNRRRTLERCIQH